MLHAYVRCAWACMQSGQKLCLSRMDSTGPIDSLCHQWGLWADCLDALASQSLHWLHIIRSIFWWHDQYIFMKSVLHKHSFFVFLLFLTRIVALTYFHCQIQTEDRLPSCCSGKIASIPLPTCANWERPCRFHRLHFSASSFSITVKHIAGITMSMLLRNKIDSFQYINTA